LDLNSAIGNIQVFPDILGLWKQYCAEFLDNALDAIESFQWNELDKEDSQITFTLDQELFLENFSILQQKKEGNESEELSDSVKRTLMDEITKPSEPSKESVEKEKKKQEKEKPKAKKKEDIEELEVKKIVEDMESLIEPIDSVNIIDKEPIVIIRLTESEAHSLLTGEIDVKNVMSYKFEVFDNGLGMNPSDLKKYGKYLASSKSMELKQTRGSQGFGAPSAFSDAQNTTGKPIVSVSKTANNLYATASEYFTTSKNEKRYVVSPTEIDVPFLHGTYTKLNYLNIKYNRGFVDVYVKETALMNPHVTIIYIDPYNEEHIYPRKVSSFPAEPKYAKPHPSSTNIGDLQDLLAKSDHLALTSFLQDNFVRVSYNTAKEVVDLAEKDLQDNLDFLILQESFITKAKKNDDKIYYIRYEERVYGRSNKPRKKLIIYEVIKDSLREQYWEQIKEYNKKNEEINNLNNKIKNLKEDIQAADTKKEQRKIRKIVREHRETIDNIRAQKDSIRDRLNKIFQNKKEGLKEIKTKKIVKEFKDKVKEVQISEIKPGELTNKQFNSLFFAFKSIKYMAPPTDTVVPVGDVVLENTLIKELGLKVSENLDDFDSPKQNLIPIEESLMKRKKKNLLSEKSDDETLDSEEIEIEKNELLDINSKILSSLYIEDDNFEPEGLKDDLNTILSISESSKKVNYRQIFEYFVENFTKDDDFVGAETRDPVSGKGLAYIVEGVLAYGNNLDTPKRSRDVLSRFVNRTPKLRDTAGCAITKAVKSVNWKNYKLDSFDNGLPKGPIKLLVNVSGPYVHLMFKSQSKNSLAEDENLMDEIKYCLEAIGRRLRIYLNRRARIRRKKKRANLIERYVPKFVESLYNIALEGSKYKDQINKGELEKLIKAPIGSGFSEITENIALKTDKGKIIPAQVKKEKPKLEKKEPPKKIEEDKEIEEEKQVKKEKEEEGQEEEIDYENLEEYTVEELKGISDDKDIDIPSRARKAEIIKTIQRSVGLLEEEKEEEEEEEEIDYENLEKYTVKELKGISDDKDIDIPSRARKAEIIKTIQRSVGLLEEEKEEEEEEKVEKPKREKPKPKAPPKYPKTKQKKLPVITTDGILKALNNNKWQTIKQLIFTMRIKDMLDARLLQVKLKELERKDKVDVKTKKGKKYFKLK
jgi:DNA topoisomerase VI B subunit